MWDTRSSTSSKRKGLKESPGEGRSPEDPSESTRCIEQSVYLGAVRSLPKDFSEDKLVRIPIAPECPEKDLDN